MKKPEESMAAQLRQVLRLVNQTRKDVSDMSLVNFLLTVRKRKSMLISCEEVGPLTSSAELQSA